MKAATDENIRALAKQLCLPMNHNPTFEQMRAAGIEPPRRPKLPPEPPPMRVGDKGDTIDRHGVRRKADGNLSNALDELSVAIMILIVACLGLGVFIGIAIAHT